MVILRLETDSFLAIMTRVLPIGSPRAQVFPPSPCDFLERIYIWESIAKGYTLIILIRSIQPPYGGCGRFTPPTWRCKQVRLKPLAGPFIVFDYCCLGLCPVLSTLTPVCIRGTLNPRLSLVLVWHRQYDALAHDVLPYGVSTVFLV
jgi:hypothetical protein